MAKDNSRHTRLKPPPGVGTDDKILRDLHKQGFPYIRLAAVVSPFVVLIVLILCVWDLMRVAIAHDYNEIKVGYGDNDKSGEVLLNRPKDPSATSEDNHCELGEALTSYFEKLTSNQ